MIVIELDKAIKLLTGEYIKKIEEFSGVRVKHFRIDHRLPSRANDKQEDKEITITIKYKEK